MKYNLIIGRHCLNKKPNFLLGALKETLIYQANSLMIFLGAPQNSFRQSLEVFKITEFKKELEKSNLSIKNVIVHGSYLINLANTLNEKIFNYSVNFLREEIERMKKIGLETIVLHPGNALEAEPKKACLKLAEGLNLILKKNDKINIALETMSGKGSEIGINFEQLKFIIDNVKLKEKIGVCWDTCHLYSAGYDVKNNLEEVIKEFDEKISLEKLWIIHLNDSQFELGSKRDRHENIGYGKIGKEALKKIVFHSKFNGIPKLLETPRKKNFQEEIKDLLDKVN